jgi:hypothetical protein
MFAQESPDQIAMRRVQFFEIHEQPWVPSSIRDASTDALQFGFNLLNAYAAAAPLLERALDSTHSQSIVDLCSGGGGPWFELHFDLQFDLGRKIEANPPLQIWLTDKYPSLSAVEKVGAASEHHIRYYPSPVDAAKVPVELKGFRTMFTSFHHFSPDEASAILQNAVDAGEGIGIFEITRRSPSTIALMFAWALLLFVSTPWIRPFRWSRLFWTYLVPIIPLVWVFDGIVSCLRTYRPEELSEIVAKLSASEYRWEIGELSTARVPITYLIGCPQAGVSGNH